MPELLSVQHLSFSYKSWTDAPEKKVLDDLSLSLQAGEKLLILAPFDAGKSTFARILSALCPKYLSGTMAGKVILQGKDISKVEPWDLVTEVGYVSQNPQEQFVASSLEDELAFPLESLGTDRETMQARVRSALEKWGLSSYASVSEAQLSGGERKRVLLALTDMLDPSLWILDESFDDLDVAWRELLAKTIKESDKGIIVLASRMLSQFDGLFDRELLLEEGKIREPKGEVKADFAHISGDDQLHVLVSEPTGKHKLEMDDIVTNRRRVSDELRRVFTLKVPKFTLESGEIVTLVGSNGSGKSTFARLACGLDVPDQGRCFLDGKSVDASVLNRSVGYLFQNPDLQIFLPTVRDELAWSLQRDKRFSKAEIQDRVEEVAKLFALSLDDTPTTMSYPGRKALQAAVYYLLDRPFYILDELDNALTYAKAQTIVSLLHDRGAGILVITHDQIFSSLVAKAAFHIEDGRLLAV